MRIEFQNPEKGTYVIVSIVHDGVAYYATSRELPGLHAANDSFETLMRDLPKMIAILNNMVESENGPPHLKMEAF